MKKISTSNKKILRKVSDEMDEGISLSKNRTKSRKLKIKKNDDDKMDEEVQGLKNMATSKSKMIVKRR